MINHLASLIDTEPNCKQYYQYSRNYLLIILSSKEDDHKARWSA